MVQISLIAVLSFFELLCLPLRLVSDGLSASLFSICVCTMTGFVPDSLIWLSIVGCFRARLGEWANNLLAGDRLTFYFYMVL